LNSLTIKQATIRPRFSGAWREAPAEEEEERPAVLRSLDQLAQRLAVGYGLNERQGHHPTSRRWSRDSPAKSRRFGAFRTRAAEPGAGAKPRLRRRKSGQLF